MGNESTLWIVVLIRHLLQLYQLRPNPSRMSPLPVTLIRPSPMSVPLVLSMTPVVPRASTSTLMISPLMHSCNINRDWPTRTVWSSPRGVTSAATVATIAIRTGSPRLRLIGPRTGSLVMVHQLLMFLKQNHKKKLNLKIHVLFFNLFKNKNQLKKSFLPHKSLISNENNVTTV